MRCDWNVQFYSLEAIDDSRQSASRRPNLSHLSSLYMYNTYEYVYILVRMCTYCVDKPEIRFAGCPVLFG